MSFRPTPSKVEATYELLRTCSPYSGLKLPEADELAFRVTRHKDRYGHFRPRVNKSGFHEILVSEAHVCSLALLIETVGHEMLHLHQELSGKASSVQHNANFRRLAIRACAANGFDPKTF